MIAEPEVGLDARKQRLREQRYALRERQLAVANLMLAQAEREAKKLQENYDQWGWLGGYEDVIDRIRQPGKELYAPMSTVNDRRYGHNWPFWRTWAEHARLRASARLLCQLSPIASGALTGLRAYVLGEGFGYSATSEVGAPSALVGAVQDVIDEFLLDSGWCEVEKEGFERSRRDGELFLLHQVHERRLAVEIIEPEQVQAPPGGNGDSDDWTYGIETSGRQTHRPLAYHVVDDPAVTGDYYEPHELHHLKLNVDAKVKRGLTDFCYDTHDSIRTAGRLVDSVGQGAAIQASIALIRQHQTASPSQVRDFVTAASDYDRYDPISGRQEYSEGFRPGRVLDIDAGQEYVVPPFSTNVSGYIEVIQGVLRAVAVRWNAPEWLISANASNTNYASSVTAESPFVKRCYQEQGTYKRFFLRTIWAAVRVAAKNGRIRALGRAWRWAEVRQLVDIQVEAPRVETRDTARESQTNQTYIAAGVKSIKTTQLELGLDPDREAANMAAMKSGGAAPAKDGQEGGGNPDDPTAALRGSVGGSQALMAIQQAFYQGALPREAVIANARIVYGFSQADAEALFPEVQPTKLNPRQVGEQQGQGGGPPGGAGAPPASPPDDYPGQGGDDQGDEGNPLDALLGGDNSQPDDGLDRPDSGISEAERKDKRGRRMCFDDNTGRRTKCAPKEKEKKERRPAAKKEPKKPARKEADISDAEAFDVLTDVSGMETVGQAAEHLAKHGHAMVKKLAKQLGEKANGSTVAIAQRLVARLEQLKNEQVGGDADTEDDLVVADGDGSGGAPPPQEQDPHEAFLEKLAALDYDAAKAALLGLSEDQVFALYEKAFPEEDIAAVRSYGRDWAASNLAFEAVKRGQKANNRARVDAAYKKIREQVQADVKSAEVTRVLTEVSREEAEAQQMIDDHQDALHAAEDAFGAYAVGSKAKGKRAALERYAALQAQTKDITAAAYAKREAARARAMKVLEVPTPSRIPLTRTGSVEDATWKKVEAAQDWLQKVTAGAQVERVRVTEGEAGTRAHYKHATATSAAHIVLDETNGADIVVHELCHHLEMQPGVREALEHFLEGRCAGEEPTPMRDATGIQSYKESEKGRKDDFEKTFGKHDSWYVGKTYNNADGTQRNSELLSMAVQLLYNDPAKLAASDPELCQFIIGILHGRIRG